MENLSLILKLFRQRYVPPRRIFPTRRRTTSTTHPPITVQAPAILPDEETDSSPFDAERAEFLQRLRHLPSVVILFYPNI